MSPRPRFDSLPEERRRAILDAALAEIGERGLEGASYNRIIARAGVSKGAMYYYFDDRDDLYRTAVEDAAQRALGEIGPIAAHDDADSFWDAFSDYYARVSRYAAMHPEVANLVRPLISSPPGSQAADLIAEYRAALLDWVLALLRDGIALGAVRDDLPPELIARSVLALGEASDRWALDHWDTLTPDEIERVGEQIADLQLRIAAPPALLEARRLARKEQAR